MTSEVNDIHSEAGEVQSVATAGESQLAAGESQLAAAQAGDANPSDIGSSVANSFQVVVESSQMVESQLAAEPARSQPAPPQFLFRSDVLRVEGGVTIPARNVTQHAAAAQEFILSDNEPSDVHTEQLDASTVLTDGISGLADAESVLQEQADNIPHVPDEPSEPAEGEILPPADHMNGDLISRAVADAMTEARIEIEHQQADGWIAPGEIPRGPSTPKTGSGFLDPMPNICFQC